MSCAIFTTAALVDMTADVLRTPCTLRLYAAVGPVDEPIASDFVEPTGGGYAPKPMQGAAWDLSNAPDEAVYPEQAWTFTGPAGLVLGFYITRNSDGALRWYEPFTDENGDPAPMRIINDGDRITVTPTFSFEEAADDEEDDEAPDQDDVASKSEQPS